MAASPSSARGAEGQASPSPSPQATVLRGAAASTFLERTYRPFLPSAVGPLTTEIAGDQITAEAEVDVRLLKRELHAPVPDFLDPLLRGKPTLRISGKIVGSGNGVARLRLDGVWVSGIPIPELALEHFLRGELESRGFEAPDPLVRPLLLPAGVEAAAIEGGQLRLTGKNAR